MDNKLPPDLYEIIITGPDPSLITKAIDKALAGIHVNFRHRKLKNISMTPKFIKTRIAQKSAEGALVNMPIGGRIHEALPIDRTGQGILKPARIHSTCT